jgi:YfiH family protein
LRHGFSTRRGGTTPEGSLNLGYLDWDTRKRVNENRRRFLSALGLGHASMATLAQVHSDQVHIITGDKNQWNRPPEGDALLTRESGIALAVRVADCLPILLTDPDKRAIGAFHAGWRGILAHILVKTVNRMRDAFGSDPARMVVAVGPGIRSCCMEVGPEVACLFDREFPNRTLSRSRKGEAMLDLQQALEADRAEAGIDRENFFDLGLCTRCNPEEFYSYRGEGEASGRMMAAIGFGDL